MGQHLLASLGRWALAERAPPPYACGSALVLVEERDPSTSTLLNSVAWCPSIFRDFLPSDREFDR